MSCLFLCFLDILAKAFLHKYTETVGVEFMNTSWKKRFILYLTGQALSAFGSSLVQFAITWHIALLTQSGVMLMLAAVFGFLPQVLISLPAGAWADRFNRKKLLIIADGSLAITAAILAFLFMTGYEHLWLLFIISAVRSFGLGIRGPAVVSIIPSLVPMEQLARVNGIQASVSGITTLAAPVLAGGLYATVGIHALFFGDVISGVLAISFLCLITIPARDAPKSNSMWASMVDGIKYASGTSWLRLFLIIYVFFSLMFGPVVFLTPLLIIRTFGDVAWYLAIRETSLALGMIAGGLLSGIIAGKFKNKFRLTLLLFGFFGFTTLLLGLSGYFWLFIGIVALIGITMSLINSCAITVFQTFVDSDYLGRVFSVLSIIAGLTMPISMTVFGPLADVVPVEWLITISGGVMLIVALFSMRLKAWTAFDNSSAVGNLE